MSKIRSVSIRRMAKLVAYVFLLVIGSWIGQVAPALAQDYDWTLNANDTGYDPVPVNGTVVYAVTVENNGPVPTPANTLRFNIPAGGQVTAVSGGLSCTPALPLTGPTQLACTLPVLAPTEIFATTFTMTASTKGILSYSFSVDTAGDANPADNTISSTTTVTDGADLGLEITGPATAAAGSTIGLNAVVTNLGPDPISGGMVEVPIPAGSGLANVVFPPGCTLSGSVYRCPVPGTLAAGATYSIPFSAQVAAASTSDLIILGSVGGTDPFQPGDPNPANNSFSLPIDVTSGTDLAITKTRSPGSALLLVGDTVTFTLSSHYTGDVPSGIVIEDTLPASYSVTGISAPGWDCSPSAGQLVRCEMASGTVPGANVALGDIVITAEVVGAGAAVRNTASVGSAVPADQNPANDIAQDAAANIEEPRPMLAGIKTGQSPAIISAGQNYDFQIGATNTGNVPFVGTITLTDVLPAELTYLSHVPNGWSCSPATGSAWPARVGTVTCTITYTSGSPLPIGASTPLASVTTQADPDMTTPVRVTNTLQVGATGITTIPDVTVDLGIELETDSADLIVTKTADSASVQVGGTQSFTITVRNTGPATSTNVELSDTLIGLINSLEGPTNAGLVSHSVLSEPAGTTTSCSSSPVGGQARQLDCTIDTLGVGEEVQVRVTVRPGGTEGARSNTADAFSPAVADPNWADNTASAGFDVTPLADLTVSKVADKTEVPAGQDLTYAIAVTNASTIPNPGGGAPIPFALSPARAVTVTETLPLDVIFLSVTGATCTGGPAPGAVVTSGNQTMTCSLGDIASGVVRSFEIRVMPRLQNANATPAQVVNGVTVATTTPEVDSGNNSASVTTPVTIPRLDLQVNKTDSPDPVTVGDNVTYSLLVANNGPSAAENVVLTDQMPADPRFTFVSHTAPGDATCTPPAVGSSGGELICSFPLLRAGESRTVTLVALATAKGTSVNRATILADGVSLVDGDTNYDSATGNNVANEPTSVRTRVDLSVVKTGPVTDVELREDFDYTIVLTNIAQIGYGEADAVVLSDTLPSGVVLTGAPTFSLEPGTTVTNAGPGACTGTAGGTSFSCSFGTLSAGGVVTLTVPVEVVSVSGASPHSLTNTASVTTSSFDMVAGNNSDDATISVLSFQLEGNVYRDFNDDGDYDRVSLGGNETGIPTVDLYLTGTYHDGTVIPPGTPFAVTTDSSGHYVFPNLPRGTYTITRGDPPNPGNYLADGAATAGSHFPGASGAGDGLSVSGIVLTATGPADPLDGEINFGLVPRPALGLAKRVTAGPTLNADGSFDVTFAVRLANLGFEPLRDITVSDRLDDGGRSFGTWLADGVDPTPGHYRMLAAPGGDCTGPQAAFNGTAGGATLISGGTLAVGATCDVTIQIRVWPTDPQPTLDYLNQASGFATGDYSGRTTPTDLSDNGTSADPDGNGDPTDPGEDDPTPVAIPPMTASITVVKTPTVPWATGEAPEVGDVVTYTFTITNTGAVNLTDVTLTDTMMAGATGTFALTGSPIPLLAPGEVNSVAYSASYTLTQADLDRGFVDNDASVSGTPPRGDAVTDDTDASVTGLSQPSISLTKTADSSALDPVEPLVGQIITYSFLIENTGNVTLTGITLDDPLVDGLPRTPATIPDLAPGGTVTVTVDYPITQAEIELGFANNTASVTGTPPTGPAVTDDDSTSTPVGQVPRIELEKIGVAAATDETLAAGHVFVTGDTVYYRFRVTNTGNVALRDIVITDPKLGLTIPLAPLELAPGDEHLAAVAGEWVVTADDLVAGQIDNTASVIGDSVVGTETATDSDDETVIVLTIEAVSEPPFVLVDGDGAPLDGGTTTTILASDLLGGEPATLDNVDITVLGTSDPGVTLDPSTGLITVAPGLPAGSYTVDYRICAKPPYEAICDEATETVVQGPRPAIETVKSQVLTDDGDGIDGVGDLMTYTIIVTNSGNTVLENVALDDTFRTITGVALSLDAGPTFVSADAGSPEGELQIGESATYTATFTLTVEAVSGEGLWNQVLATADPVYPQALLDLGFVPAQVSDLSDNDVDTDGNLLDDPTVYPIARSMEASGLTVTKTAARVIVERGSVVPYTITITNDNVVVSGELDIIDILPPGFLYQPGSATLEGAAFDVVVNGRVVTWPRVRVPPLTTITATLVARVPTGADAGDHVNTAQIRNPDTGELMAAPATAVVKILPEPVFDCGDVIGKVFDDQNRDGYQNEGEPGIPAVRVVGVDGTIITTDKHGRFHVPCAMLPADRGSNFILKLDTRSLPAGYRITTENPRVVRLTPGKMTELNFGAAITKVVRIDLNDRAFATGADGKTGLTKLLAAGIDKLLAQIEGEPVNLRLAYHLPKGQDSKAARKEAARHTALVERYIRKVWGKVGRVKLTIEHTIVLDGK